MQESVLLDTDDEWKSLMSEVRALLPNKSEKDWIINTRLDEGPDYNLFYVTIDSSKNIRLRVYKMELEKFEVWIEVYKVGEMVYNKLETLKSFQVCLEIGLNRLEHCEKNMLAIEGCSVCTICDCKYECDRNSEWDYNMLKHLLDVCTGNNGIKSALKT